MADYRDYAAEERADRADKEYTTKTGYSQSSSGGYGQTNCIRCGALVFKYLVHDGKTGHQIHDAWHKSLATVADDARWGGMNRPIGGTQ